MPVIDEALAHIKSWYWGDQGQQHSVNTDTESVNILISNSQKHLKFDITYLPWNHGMDHCAHLQEV